MSHPIIKQTTQRSAVIVLLLILLTACVSVHQGGERPEAPQPTLPIVHYPEFGQRPRIIDREELFYLPEHQVGEFLRFFNDPSNASTPGHKRVANYVENFVADFRYHDDTQTAEQSARLQVGNCLSLAILMTAYARLANIEVGYQLVSSPPVYDQQGSFVLVIDHVRSYLYDPTYVAEKGVFVLTRPGLIVDYFPTLGARFRGNVSEREFIAMYYRNKAADAMVEENYSLAYWLLQVAIEHAGEHAHATNMLAIVYDRMGYSHDAENLYRYGIEHHRNKLRLLSNYRDLLIRQNRQEEALAIQRRIGSLDDKNPYNWLELANHALQRGDLDDAKYLYDKVIELAPYLHEGYAGLAKIYFQKGNNKTAREYMQQALERSYRKSTRSLYKAKMAALAYRF